MFQEEEDVNMKFQGIQKQFDKLQFGLKIISDKHSKQIEENTLKIQELEQKINQLQLDNEKKQQNIDNLMIEQQKLMSDLKKIWNHMSKILKTQRIDSQMTSTLQIDSDQFSKLQLDLPQQTKQIIQQEIQNRFVQIKEVFLKKSEFDEYNQIIEEKLETLKQKLLSQPELQQNNKRDSYQQSTNSQFQFQPLSQLKGNNLTIKQYLLFYKNKKIIRKKRISYDIKHII
ncbi:unnamed protein product [Paramecium pentaurelia]|uniref:Uncharacterized protein n=1 Tax=Paramecium pentaurelia TaxID=43138 RepID=A0A8S1U9H3_9CILI|nr:unnamed protein product [Paramecium pentaurelia]